MKSPIPHDHWPDDAPLVREAYRLDQRKELLATWGASLLLICGGTGLGCTSWFVRSGVWCHILWGCGLVALSLGLLLNVAGLRRVFERDRYVALRDDGLVLRAHDGPWLIRWDDLAEVYCDEGTEVALALHDGSEILLTDTYMGVDCRELAQRIHRARLRALWRPATRRHGGGE